MASKDEMARSFGAAANEYQAGRPSYPAEAVSWMLEPAGGSAARVADVGAGTGKLTGVVLGTGVTDVVAIDPDSDMLTALSAALPSVSTAVGIAEELPLDDESRDAVVMGQAWHWVEPAAGSAEIARVLRPGGVLGLIWNIRDASVTWVSRMSEIMHNSNAEIMLEGAGPEISAPFEVIESKQWEWSRPMTREKLFAMARSRSYLITASEAERAEVEAQLGDLFDELGLIDDATIELPYVTTAFRAVRP